MEGLLADMRDLLYPWWVEICFLIFFPLGYCFLYFDLSSKGRGKKAAPTAGRGTPRGGPGIDPRAERLQKSMEEDMAAGDAPAALKGWRQVQAKVASTGETLRLVVQAFAAVSPGTMVDELVEHLETHAYWLCNAKSAVTLLDAAAHIHNAQLMEEVNIALRDRLAIPPTYQVYEALLSGNAVDGNEQRVDELVAEIASIGQKVTARGFSLIIKGFLHRGMLAVALRYVKAMRSQGFYVPPFAVGLLCRVAAEHGQASQALEELVEAGVPLSTEAMVILVEDAFRRGDLPQANRAEAAARSSGMETLPAFVYDPLLKLNVSDANLHALELFAEMRKANHRIGEGLCARLLQRSAESKFLRFAEEVARYCKSKDQMTVNLYSALMKVYSYSGLYHKACDLYAEIKEVGLVPDSTMYGCLMRFAAECGRSDLSQELAQTVPELDIQNYMSLIRGAGRDKDVDRAFAVFGRLKDSGAKVDIAAYNCVLDVCASAGALGKGRALMNEMRTKIGPLDIITYNTMMKGVCAAGDLKGAWKLLEEIESQGLKPNDVTYNCMVNAAVTNGTFRQAWEVIAAMEANGIKVDHYTVSIMMKALKRYGGPREVSRTLKLLDDAGLDVCSEEVLLNSVIEACIRLREIKRLQGLCMAYESSGVKPSQHTYGSLIKAFSTLRRLERCRELWKEMVEDRGMEPNDIVLGCMLDALVCNERVSEAVTLFRKWKDKTGANMILYSTMIKGFAGSGRSREAMEMWREMKAEGLTLNTVVYNALIDAQARLGQMDEVSILWESMASDGIAPDSITHSTIVKGYCVKGDMEKAFEVFRNMQRSGLATECIVYNTILDGCVKRDEMKMADMVLEDLKKNQVTPSNFTLGILVKMYGRRRQLDKAFQAVEELPKEWGFDANAQVKTCLMSACISNNALSKALDLFEEIKLASASIDSKAFGVLLSGCVRAGHIQQAVGLVEQAYGLNGNKRLLPPSQNILADNLEALMRAINGKGLLEKVGMPLLASLREAKVPVNGRLLSSVMEGDAGAAEGQLQQPQASQQQRRRGGGGSRRNNGVMPAVRAH